MRLPLTVALFLIFLVSQKVFPGYSFSKVVTGFKYKVAGEIFQNLIAN